MHVFPRKELSSTAIKSWLCDNLWSFQPEGVKWWLQSLISFRLLGKIELVWKVLQVAFILVWHLITLTNWIWCGWKTWAMQYFEWGPSVKRLSLITFECEAEYSRTSFLSMACCVNSAKAEKRNELQINWLSLKKLLILKLWWI